MFDGGCLVASAGDVGRLAGGGGWLVSCSIRGGRVQGCVRTLAVCQCTHWAACGFDIVD